MPGTIHMMGPEQFKSPELRETVLNCFASTLTKIEAVHPIDRMDIVLFPTSNHCGPDGFTSGMCHSTHAIECSFNPDHPKFESEFEIRLPPLLIHEVHHALRYRYAGPWTVGENLVLEGLAMAAERQFGYGADWYKPELPKAVMQKLRKRSVADRHNPINPEADPKTYSWIWQSHSDDYNANMYHAGIDMIERALAKMKRTAFDTISEPYDLFFQNA